MIRPMRFLWVMPGGQRSVLPHRTPAYQAHLTPSLPLPREPNRSSMTSQERILPRRVSDVFCLLPQREWQNRSHPAVSNRQPAATERDFSIDDQRARHVASTKAVNLKFERSAEPVPRFKKQASAGSSKPSEQALLCFSVAKRAGSSLLLSGKSRA
jgi:hypothetical protein